MGAVVKRASKDSTRATAAAARAQAAHQARCRLLAATQQRIADVRRGIPGPMAARAWLAQQASTRHRSAPVPAPTVPAASIRAQRQLGLKAVACSAPRILKRPLVAMRPVIAGAMLASPAQMEDSARAAVPASTKILWAPNHALIAAPASIPGQSELCLMAPAKTALRIRKRRLAAMLREPAFAMSAFRGQMEARAWLAQQASTRPRSARVHARIVPAASIRAQRQLSLKAVACSAPRILTRLQAVRSRVLAGAMRDLQAQMDKRV